MSVLDSNFQFNFSGSLIDPMVQQLNEYYLEFSNRINNGRTIYNNLKSVCVDILKDIIIKIISKIKKECSYT